MSYPLFPRGGRNKYQRSSVPWREETESRYTAGKAKAAIELQKKGAYIKDVLQPNFNYRHNCGLLYGTGLNRHKCNYLEFGTGDMGRSELFG